MLGRVGMADAALFQGAAQCGAKRCGLAVWHGIP
jgi:hypothetical protein